MKTQYRYFLPNLIVLTLLFVSWKQPAEQATIITIPQQLIGSWLYIPADSIRPNGTGELKKVNFCSLDLQQDGSFFYTYTYSRKNQTNSGLFCCGRYELTGNRLKLTPGENFLTDEIVILDIDSSKLVIQFSKGKNNSQIVWQRCKRNEDISIDEDSTQSKIYSFPADFLMRDSYMNQSKDELSPELNP